MYLNNAKFIVIDFYPMINEKTTEANIFIVVFCLF